MLIIQLILTSIYKKYDLWRRLLKCIYAPTLLVHKHHIMGAYMHFNERLHESYFF